MESTEENEFFQLKALITDKSAISRMLLVLQEIACIRDLVNEYLGEVNEKL